MGPPSCSVREVVDDIVKSPQDKKLYRYVQLSNGLSVLLIHDPEMHAAPTEHKELKAGTHEEECSADGMDEDESEDEEDGTGESMDEDGSDEDEDGSGEDSEEGEEGAGRGKKGAPAAGVKKAAAAMAVGIGSLSDPPYMQGLSHYLEHMLFMGSTKYPDENEYDDFITKHSGSSNAYTELETTNFHFEVEPNSLYGALDRFAQFFISPLMLAGSLEREVLAVDSEFSGVQQSDDCRVSQLMCHTARADHPYRQFSWGNKRSLWDQPLAEGRDIRQHIQDYYKQHYSAERMSLVLLGGEPLDTLQGWVLELFEGLPTGCGPRPSFAGMPPPFEGHGLYVMPAVRDNHEVSLTFQLPSMWANYGAKAEHYVSHLVGHEGPGSLLAHLKSLGWASEMCAGIDEDGYSQNSGAFLFTITIGLTEAGLAAAPGCGLAVVGAVFAYLRLLRETGPQEWVWKEMACIADMKFRFQEEEEAMDMCTKIASMMHVYRPQDILAAEHLHQRYDPELVSKVLSAMHPTSSAYRVDLLTRQYAETKQVLRQVAGGEAVTEQVEPWFNMEATWTQIPSTLCESWATTPPPPEMHLPPPNPYIATDFTVKSLPVSEQGSPEAYAAAVAASAAADKEETTALSKKLQLPLVLATPPSLVHDQPGLRVWHKLDRTFCTPRANVFFKLSSPGWCDNARSAALTYLGLKLLEDALNEDAYLADVAGLHYSTSPEGLHGVELKVDGFSHKLPLLADRLLRVLAAAEFTGATWATVHEALCRKYRNMNMQVSKHANYERLYALCARAIHYSLVEAELIKATLADVQAHVKKALTTCHLEVFCHGNLTLPEALQLASAAQAALGPGCTGAASARVRDHCVALPPGVPLLLNRPTRNPEEENCAVETYYQAGVASNSSDRALSDLVDQLVYEPAYNTLRTKQQLGYTVYSGSRLTHGVLGFCVVVVSASHTAETVDQRVEEFLASFEEKLAQMTEAELDEQKAALVSNKLARDRALADESTRQWDHIWNERYDFFSREAEVAALEGITLKQVRTWWSTHLSASSPARRKMAVHVVPTKACAAFSALVPVENGNGASKAKPVKAKPATRGKAKRAEGSASVEPQPMRVLGDIDVFKKECEAIKVHAASLPPVLKP